MDQLRRSRDRRVVAGVAGGLAERLGVDPILIRVAFVIATMASSGLGIIAYIVLWAVLPEADTLEDLLGDRLELGEITAEEYRQILSDIDPARRRPR